MPIILTVAHFYEQPRRVNRGTGGMEGRGDKEMGGWEGKEMGGMT